MSTAVPPSSRRDGQPRGGRVQEGTSVAYILDLPGTPPSFNAIGLHSHWTKGRKVKQQWQEMIETMLMVEQVPRGMRSAKASAEIHFKQRRRRDSGNFRTILEKVTGDALVRGGWIEDDTPEFYRFDDIHLLAPYEVSNTVLLFEFVRA